MLCLVMYHLFRLHTSIHPVVNFTLQHLAAKDTDITSEMKQQQVWQAPQLEPQQQTCHADDIVAGTQTRWNHPR